MFRPLLLIAMIFQVLGCPYACMAGLPGTSDGSRTVGCRCCEHKRCAEKNLPSQEQESSTTACFCNSPIVAAPAAHVDQDTLSTPFWTIAALPAQHTVVAASNVFSEHRPPGNEAGMDLRVAVQSLLL